MFFKSSELELEFLLLLLDMLPHPGISPVQKTGVHVAPNAWNKKGVAYMQPA